MPRTTKRRHLKANQKLGLSNSDHLQNHDEEDAKEQPDPELADRTEVIRNIDLLVHLPDGAHPEFVPDYPASFYDMEGGLRLRLFDVVLFLKKQGYALESTYISYYSAVFSAHVNCNTDPVSKTIWLS